MISYYTLNLAALTVTRTDPNGEQYDLNANGEPCKGIDDLRAFVVELNEQGFYAAAVRDDLLGKLPTITATVVVDGAEYPVTLRAQADAWRWFNEQGSDLELSGATAAEAVEAAFDCWGSSVIGIFDALDTARTFGRHYAD
jgi:hypothetical protein